MGMNPEVKTEWLKRLREPGRKQIKGRLQTDKGQCCLGVLCEIAAEQGVITIERKIIHLYDDICDDIYLDEVMEIVEYDGATRIPTSTVAIWAGLEHKNGEMESLKSSTGYHIVCLNDDGTPFSEIADIIQTQL